MNLYKPGAGGHGGAPVRTCEETAAEDELSRPEIRRARFCPDGLTRAFY